MTDLMNFINNILWGSVLIYLLLGTGIYFTLRTRFIQLRHFSHMFSVLKNSNKSDSAGISSFQALCTTLAARVGTGNLTGVAIALTAGGPGAIFWMWVVAFIGMATSFVESSLAQLYKTKDDNGNYRGGPAYYMEKGLGMRWMGVLFSIFLIIAFGLVFNAVQANSIAQASAVAFHLQPLHVGIGLVVLSGVVIFGGIRSIAKVAELVVPLMAGAYLLLALWVIGHNIEHMPAILALIFKSAFGLQEAAAGAVGYGISQAMTQGVQRGLFSNEAGMGSAPNAAASASPYPPHPASQGYVQMLGGIYRYHRHLQRHRGDHPLLRHSRSADRQHQRHRSDPARAVDRRRQLGGAVRRHRHLLLRLYLDHRQLRLCREQPGIPRAQPPGRPDHFPLRGVGHGDVRRTGGAAAGVENGGYFHGADGHHQSDGHPAAVAGGAEAGRRLPSPTPPGQAADLRRQPLSGAEVAAGAGRVGR